jgi:hypothetical protein
MSRLASLAALFIAALLCGAPVAAQAAEAPEPPPAAVQAKIDALFAQLKAGKVAEGYNQAFAGTLMSKKQADLEQMIAATETALRYYGAVRDWQLIETRRPVGGFAVAIYLLRAENGPLFARLQFYDNGAKWIVYNVALGDSYDQMNAW